VANSTKRGQFFSFAVHVLYAIVLGSSFTNASLVFVPLENTITTPETIANTIATFVIYFILVVGWISYSLAIIENPHKPNENGALRFAMDITILTLLFYVVNLTHPKVFIGSFWHVFTWILPVLFVAFCIWDGVELKEYRGASKKTMNKIWAQLTKSVLGLILMFFQSIAFAFAVWYYHVPDWVAYIGFSITTFLIMLYYRISGWKIARMKPGYVRSRRT
jgi:hypothetical protein